MNKKRFIWLVPVLVMALAMSVCKSDDDGGIGDNLKFSDEQIFTADGSRYTGDITTFTSTAGGNGSIKGGKMSFSIGVPGGLKPMDAFLAKMDEKIGYSILSRAEYKPGNTQAADLEFTIRLSKKTDAMSTASKTMENVYYIYVDRDCTVTATGIPPITYEGVSVPVTNINLSLKKGWNPVSLVLAATANGTLVIGTGDSDTCKWILELL